MEQRAVPKNGEVGEGQEWNRLSKWSNRRTLRGMILTGITVHLACSPGHIILPDYSEESHAMTVHIFLLAWQYRSSYISAMTVRNFYLRTMAEQIFTSAMAAQTFIPAMTVHIFLSTIAAFAYVHVHFSAFSILSFQPSVSSASSCMLCQNHHDCKCQHRIIDAVAFYLCHMSIVTLVFQHRITCLVIIVLTALLFYLLNVVNSSGGFVDQSVNNLKMASSLVQPPSALACIFAVSHLFRIMVEAAESR